MEILVDREREIQFYRERGLPVPEAHAGKHRARPLSGDWIYMSNKLRHISTNL